MTAPFFLNYCCFVLSKQVSLLTTKAFGSGKTQLLKSKQSRSRHVHYNWTRISHHHELSTLTLREGGGQNKTSVSKMQAMTIRSGCVWVRPCASVGGCVCLSHLFSPPPSTASVWARLSHYWQDSLSIHGNEFHPWNGDRSNQHDIALWKQALIHSHKLRANWLNLPEDDLWSNQVTHRLEKHLYRFTCNQLRSPQSARRSRVPGKDWQANGIKRETAKVKGRQMSPYLCFSSSLCDDLKGQADKMGSVSAGIL